MKANNLIPFRILSLSGGGCRGIFQAIFLSHLQKKINTPLHQQFDLIAGTSTGAIVAVALALGIDAERISDLYRNHSKKIFDPKLLYYLRKGPRCNQNVLRETLENVIGNKQIRDAKTHIVVAATCIDQFRHRIFSSFPAPDKTDAELSAVDVVLSSSAAPTYFEAVKPSAQERSYVDGGLWANSPTLLAILYANSYLKVPMASMRVLSVGTGDFSQGAIRTHFNSKRPYSPEMIKMLFEIMFSSQQSSAVDHARILLGNDNFMHVSAQMDDIITLDDTEKALIKLPPLAEGQASEHIGQVLSLLKSEAVAESPPVEADREFVPAALVEASGLTGFYPSRRYYHYRAGVSSIDTYISKARKSLVMVSINLWTGLPFDNLCKVLKSKLEDTSLSFSATISLLNPLNAEIIFSISPALNRTKEQLYTSIKDTISELSKFKSTLSSSAKERFNVRVHNTIPFGSAILIDHNEEYGRIQIETKPYKAVLNDSFAFEIAPYGSSGFYKTLVNGYELLMKDGNAIEEVDLESFPSDVAVKKEHK